MPRWLLWLAVGSMLLGFLIYKEPLPDGFQNPHVIKPLLFVVRGFSKVAELVEWMGWGRKVILMRSLYNLGAQLGKLRPSPVTTREMVFDGIPVRLYVPPSYKADGKDQSAIVFYHGGGWCIGSPDSHDTTTKYLAQHTPALVISVDYRLAPEHICPAAYDDCLAATKHFLKHAHDFGVSPNRVTIMGDSAGGAIAAGVALALRDARFTPQPAAQVLIYPSVQKIDLKTPSFQQNSQGTVMDIDLANLFTSTYLTGTNELVPYIANNSHVDPVVRKTMMEKFIRHADLPKENLYAPYKPPDLDYGFPHIWDKLQEGLLDPYQAPLLAQSHANLPPAYLFTCQFDVIRDDGFLYASKLKRDGTQVEHFNLKIGFHGLITMVNEIPETRESLDRMIKFIKNIFKNNNMVGDNGDQGVKIKMESDTTQEKREDAMKMNSDSRDEDDKVVKNEKEKKNVQNKNKPTAKVERKEDELKKKKNTNLNIDKKTIKKEKENDKSKQKNTKNSKVEKKTVEKTNKEDDKNSNPKQKQKKYRDRDANQELKHIREGNKKS